MADCVNADSGLLECWPSYAYLAKRTSLNAKTVEAGVSRLKQDQYIVDTGKRAGDTGKVVVYRLNATENGGVLPGLHETSASDTRPHNAPENGVIRPNGNDPVFSGNPPKNGSQSPQKVEEIPPKTGARTRNGTSNGTGKRTRGGTAVAVTSIAGVPDNLLAEWVQVRTDKRAKTLTETAVNGLLREAAKAGLSPEQAVRMCVERNWISLNAGWLVGDVSRQAEPAWRTEQRQRTQIAAPGVAVKDRKDAADFFIDAEVKRVSTDAVD